MYTAVDQLGRVSFRFKSLERLENDALFVREMQVTMTQEPLNIELEMVKPNKGTRVVYDPSYRRTHAKVYVNLGLGSLPTDFAIYGSTLMNNAHHPLTASGFQPIVQICQAAEALARKENRYDEIFTDKGVVEYDGRQCQMIEVNDKRHTTRSYTAAPGETVNDIAAKFKVNEFKILQLNEGIEKFTQKVGGKKLTLPTSYAPYVLLYIETTSHLPYMVEVRDEKGLFERYYFYNVERL
ncbi:MAG: DUF1571 domain-containing protein [Bacteroidota bacterium]